MHIASKKVKLPISFILILFIALIALPGSVYLARHIQDTRKIAKEPASGDKNILHIPAKYKPGELLIVFGESAPTMAVKKGVSKNIEKDPLTFIELDEKTIPASLQNINSIYKLNKIEKVFKGVQDPQKELSKLKNLLPNRRINDKEIMSVDLSKTYKLSFETNTDIEQVIDTFRQQSDVKSVSPNYYFRTSLIPDDPYIQDHYPDTISNRDPNWNPPYDYQYNLKKVSMPQAWEIATGSASIIVAVVDTGIDYTHPELGSCTLTQVNNYDCPFILPGISITSMSSDPIDAVGHGTHVSGIITGMTDNSYGIASINHLLKILPVRVFDTTGSTTLDTVAAGIIYSTNHGANIINLSLGMGPLKNIPDTLKQSLDFADGAGVTLIAAAGNENDDTGKGYWPASYYKVISVGATDHNDQKAGFSNYGLRVDMMAPGTETVSLRAGTTDMYCPDACGQHVINTKFYRANGTSFSAPAVAGAAALLLAHDPSLSPMEIRFLLRNGADKISGLEFDLNYGYGRLNAASSLTSSIPPVAVITSPENMTSLSGGQLSIIGTAIGRNFSSYTIQTGISLQPASWSSEYITLVNGGTQPVTNDVLGTIDLNLLATNLYTVKLEVTDTSGVKSEWRIAINIDKDILTGFPYSTEDRIWSSSITDDINGDGQKEVLFASYDHKLYLVNSSGNNQSGWPVTLQGSVYSSPVVADINSDGIKEIIISDYSHKLSAYHPSGNLLWSVDTDNIHNSPVIGHFTQLVYNEIMILGYSGYLEIYDGVGNRIINQRILPSGGYILYPVVYDSNHDGRDEIIFPMDSNSSGSNKSIKIYTYDSSSKNLIEKKSITVPCIQNNELSGPSVGDIDNDGTPEVIAGCKSTPFLGIWDIESGNLEWFYSFDVVARQQNLFYAYSFSTPVTLADINNDHNLEIITAGTLVRGDWSDYGFGITAFTSSGQVIDGWPYFFEGQGAEAPPVVGDINSDGYDEIIAGEGSLLEDIGSKVYILHHDGTAAEGWPKMTNGGIRAAASIADLDGDGKIEIGVGSTDGKYYVWNTMGNTSDYSQWPMFAHDAYHTGVYRSSGYYLSPTPTLAPTFTPTPTLTPMPTIPAGNGAAFYLDGTTYLTVNDPGYGLLLFPYYTFEAWIKPDPWPGSKDLMDLLYRNTTAYPDPLYRIKLNKLSDSTSALDFQVGANHLLSTTAIPAGAWTHIAVTRENTIIKMYLNGIFEKQMDIGSSIPYPQSPADDLYLGGSNVNSYSYSFKGAMDEVRISQSVRDVTFNWNSGVYNQQLAPDYDATDLWRFDQNINDEKNRRAITVHGTSLYLRGQVSLPPVNPFPTIIPNPDFGQMIRFQTAPANLRSYISVSGSPYLLMGENFTIEFWMRPDQAIIDTSHGSGPHAVLSKEGLQNGSWGGYDIAVDNGGYLHNFIHLQKPDGSYFPALTSLYSGGNILEGGEWYYVKVVKQGNKFKEYLNGQLVADTAIMDSSPATEQFINPLYIGGWIPYNTPVNYSYYQGDLDDLRISNIARTENVIPAGPFIPDGNTMALYHFDGNAEDSSGNNLNGTATGVQYISYLSSTVQNVFPAPILTNTPTPTQIPTPTTIRTPTPTSLPTPTLILTHVPTPIRTATPIPNNYPVITTKTLQAARANKPYNAAIEGYDPDSNNTLSMHVEGLPQGFTMGTSVGSAGSCKQTWDVVKKVVKISCPVIGKPPYQLGSFLITAYLSDNYGGLIKQSFNLIIK